VDHFFSGIREPRELRPPRAQFPKGMWHGQKLEWDTSKPEDVRVLEFLDEMEATQGKNSVVYVRWVV
jgi:hypothetical protein